MKMVRVRFGDEETGANAVMLVEDDTSDAVLKERAGSAIRKDMGGDVNGPDDSEVTDLPCEITDVTAEGVVFHEFIP